MFSFLEIVVIQVKSSSQKQVEINESTIISQSISINRFYLIEALMFITKYKLI